MKEIAQTNGQYFVDRDGNIFNSKGLRLSQIETKKYLYVGIVILGEKKRVLVHRLVAEAFCRRDPWQSEVHHIDGDSLNNKAGNLKWMTQSEHFKIHSKDDYTAIKSTNVNTGEITLHPSFYTLKNFDIDCSAVRRCIKSGNLYRSCVWEYYHEPLDIYGKPLEVD